MLCFLNLKFLEKVVFCFLVFFAVFYLSVFFAEAQSPQVGVSVSASVLSGQEPEPEPEPEQGGQISGGFVGIKPPFSSSVHLFGKTSPNSFVTIKIGNEVVATVLSNNLGLFERKIDGL